MKSYQNQLRAAVAMRVLNPCWTKTEENLYMKDDLSNMKKDTTQYIVGPHDFIIPSSQVRNDNWQL